MDSRIDEGRESALPEGKERAAQSQKLEALGCMASGIAHDFNNILGAILGYGELAQQYWPEDAASRRYIDNLMRAAERGRLLVDRVLAFSRSELGERVPVRIQGVVEEALELLEPSLPAEMRLEKSLTSGNTSVIGDATRLHQVAMNLCTNAIKAMESGGTLRVTLENTTVTEPCSFTRGRIYPGPYVLLTVCDTGTGIPPAVLDRVFDPFFTTREVGEGTGLGLSLVDGVVHDMRGAIDVSTRLGQGTAFSVWLPAGRDAPAS
jgi:signal transduction histidine kinase